MIPANDPVKRCVIFLFYDKDGIADEYVIHMLEDVRKDSKYVLAVVNGLLTEDSRSRLLQVTDDLVVHPNVGMDVGGYREGLFYIGFKRLAEFDEVILMNYTFFGPLYPFHEMFLEMNKRDLDFWGITCHQNDEKDPFGTLPFGFLPKHINSHFIAMRQNFFTSFYYKNYIFNLPNPETYQDSITKYEVIFTKYFADRGFKWGVYADTSEFEGICSAPYMYEIQEMIPKKRCPIIKRRSFFADYTVMLENNCGESSQEAYRAIKEKTDYDTGMIWDNILRLQNLADIRQAMHFTYFLPTEGTAHPAFRTREAGVFIFGEKEKFHALLRRYEQALPENWRTEYFEGGEPYKEKILRAGRTAGETEYTLILNLSDLTAGEEPYSNGASLLYRDLENTAATSDFIGNVLDEFENEKALGMLVPPVPGFGRYFKEVGNGWAGQFDNVKKALNALGLAVPVIPGTARPMAPYGGSFWIRTELLRKLAELPLAELPVSGLTFRFLLPYLMQHFRRLTGIVMNCDYAAIEITNQDYKFRINNQTAFAKFGPDLYEPEIRRIRGLM